MPVPEAKFSHGNVVGDPVLQQRSIASNHLEIMLDKIQYKARAAKKPRPLPGGGVIAILLVTGLAEAAGESLVHIAGIPLRQTISYSPPSVAPRPTFLCGS
jgi:hypothetical protein